MHGSSYLLRVGSCSSGGQPRHGSHALEGGNWPFDLFRMLCRGLGWVLVDCEPFGFLPIPIRQLVSQNLATCLLVKFYMIILEGGAS